MINLKFIRLLLFLAVLAVAVLPLYVFFHLSPALEKYAIGEAELEAVRVAKHFSAMAFNSDQVTGKTLPEHAGHIFADVSKDFNLLKLKVFSALGEVVYSTSPEDIGKINRDVYFRETVASGRKFTKFMDKDDPSMEGQFFKGLVVETYVPVMLNGKFVGAFEIYHDVTGQVGTLSGLTSKLYRTILPISFAILAAIFFVWWRFRDDFKKRLSVQRKLRDNEHRYRTLFEQSNDAIVVFDHHGVIKQINELACRLLQANKLSLVGTKIIDLIDADAQGEWRAAIDRVLTGDDVFFESHFQKRDQALVDIEVRAGLTGRKNNHIQAIIQDVTAQKRNQLAVKHGYQTQTVLNKLLHLSLEDLTLTETLELFIYHITSFPWMGLEPKGAIFLIDDKTEVLGLKAHRGLNEELQKICAEVPFGTCLCGRCAESKEIIFANCMDERHDNHFQGIGPHGHYCVPILSANKLLLGVFTLYVQHGTIHDKLAEETLEAAASVVAGVIQRKKAEDELLNSRDVLETRVQERTVELERANLNLAKQLGERQNAENALAVALKEKDDLIVNLFEIMFEMLANRDHSTFEHALRVAEISRRIGVEMGLNVEDMEVLKLGCLVHDIGKVAIPDDVLLKPGTFDNMDRSIMQVHPLVGASLFSKHHHDYRIRRIILHHHERLDGSGYPYGLKGKEIGVLERIVAAADVFEALVARRPYKKPISRDTALDILLYEAGMGRLDRAIVKIIGKITEKWSPLEVVSEFRADYSEDLEMFRQMSYFREPLSDFYNYRYLLYLDDAKMLAKSDNPYHLIVASFPGIKEFNRNMGFIKADQILDEIGHKLHQTAEDFEGSKKGLNTVMLLRKNSDFLIYTECKDELLTILIGQIEAHLEVSRQDWALDSSYQYYKFAYGYSAEKAINEVFSVN